MLCPAIVNNFPFELSSVNETPWVHKTHHRGLEAQLIRGPASTFWVLSHLLLAPGPGTHLLNPSWLPRVHLGADEGKGPQHLGLGRGRSCLPLGLAAPWLIRATDRARLLRSLLRALRASLGEAAVPWARQQARGRGVLPPLPCPRSGEGMPI